MKRSTICRFCRAKNKNYFHNDVFSFEFFRYNTNGYLSCRPFYTEKRVVQAKGRVCARMRWNSRVVSYASCRRLPSFLTTTEDALLRKNIEE